MFCKKADDTSCSFENKADYHPNQSRQCRSSFCPKLFEAITNFFTSCFHSFGDCPNNNSDSGAHGQKDGGNSHAMFFWKFNLFFLEEIFYLQAQDLARFG